MQAIQYTLSQKYKHSEFLQVKVKFQAYPNAEDINIVRLPAWRPGRYQQIGRAHV